MISDVSSGTSLIILQTCGDSFVADADSLRDIGTKVHTCATDIASIGHELSSAWPPDERAACKSAATLLTTSTQQLATVCSSVHLEHGRATPAWKTSLWSATQGLLNGLTNLVNAHDMHERSEILRLAASVFTADIKDAARILIEIAGKCIKRGRETMEKRGWELKCVGDIVALETPIHIASNTHAAAESSPGLLEAIAHVKNLLSGGSAECSVWRDQVENLRGLSGVPELTTKFLSNDGVAAFRLRIAQINESEPELGSIVTRYIEEQLIRERPNIVWTVMLAAAHVLSGGSQTQSNKSLVVRVGQDKIAVQNASQVSTESVQGRDIESRADRHGRLLKHSTLAMSAVDMLWHAGWNDDGRECWVALGVLGKWLFLHGVKRLIESTARETPQSELAETVERMCRKCAERIYVMGLELCGKFDPEMISRAVLVEVARTVDAGTEREIAVSARCASDVLAVTVDRADGHLKAKLELALGKLRDAFDGFRGSTDKRTEFARFLKGEARTGSSEERARCIDRRCINPKCDGTACDITDADAGPKFEVAKMRRRVRGLQDSVLRQSAQEIADLLERLSDCDTLERLQVAEEVFSLCRPVCAHLFESSRKMGQNRVGEQAGRAAERLETFSVQTRMLCMVGVSTDNKSADIGGCVELLASAVGEVFEFCEVAGLCAVAKE